MDDTELVVVGAFPSRIEAEVAQGALAAADIESVITADDAGGQYANLLVPSGGVRLHVRPEDVEAAEAVLHQTASNPPAVAE